MSNETDQSYNEILEKTQKRAGKNAQRISLINLSIVISIVVMLIAIFFAWKSYRALGKAKAEIVRKNGSLKIANSLADSLRKACGESKSRFDSGIDSQNSRILKNPEQAITIIKAAEKKGEIAMKFNKEGYNFLKEKKFLQALKSFQDSENAYNGFKDSYELAFLLRRNKDKFSDVNVQKYLLKKIFNEYNHLRIIKEDDFKYL